LAVAERNLARVQTILDKIEAKPVPRMRWEDEDAS
jgi:hypothetical protein